MPVHWWLVRFNAPGQDEQEGEFALVVQGETCNFIQFKTEVASNFELRVSDFYFEDALDRRTDETNIIQNYGSSCSTLFVQPRSKERVQYTQIVEILPSTKFKRNQGLRYNSTSAMCEFIDNSIQYTQTNSEDEGRVIRVEFRNKSLVIADNGDGMTKADMKTFAKLSEKGFEEDIDADYIRPEETAIKLFYADSSVTQVVMQKFVLIFNSFLSKWGTGAKLAMDKLGKKQTVVSTVRDSNIANKGFFESENPEWTITLQEVPLQRKEWENHGTEIIIDELHPIVEYDRIFQKLSSIYYFYCNGFINFLEVVFELAFAHELMRKSLELHTIPNFRQFEFKNVDLAFDCHSVDDSWIRCLDNAKSVFPIYFNFSLPPPAINMVDESHSSFFQHAAFAFIFYYPYDSTEQYPKDSPQSEWYWLGRLLPEESTTLTVMTIEANCKKIQTHFLKRTKAVIFLNRAFIPTPEKNCLITTEGGKSKLQELSGDANLINRFQDWVLDCHKQFDREFIYLDKISSTHIGKQTQLEMFKTLETMNHEKVTQGDFVELVPIQKQRTKPLYGKIAHFQYEIVQGSSIKQKQQISYFPYSINFMKQTELPTEDYEIKLLTNRQANQKKEELYSKYFPHKIATLRQPTQLRSKQDLMSDISSFSLTTAQNIEIYVYICDNQYGTIQTHFFKLHWTLKKMTSRQQEKKELVTQDLDPKTSKRFEIFSNMKLTPGNYILYISLQLVGGAEIKKKKLKIIVESAKEKELCVVEAPTHIQLGTPFHPPSLSLYDVADAPFQWSDLKNQNEFPTCKIIGDRFSFLKAAECIVGEDETIMGWKEVEVVISHATSVSPLVDGEKVTFEFSIRGLKKSVSVPLIAGAVRECEIECSEMAENRSIIPLSLHFLDQWKTPTICKQLEIQYYQPYNEKRVSAKGEWPSISYEFQSELFWKYPQNTPKKRNIRLLGPHVYSMEKGKDIYTAFSVDGDIYQTGDFFELKQKSTKGNIGMVLVAYCDEEDQPCLDLLYMASPNKQRKEQAFFEAETWHERELAYSDYHYHNTSRISATVQKRVYVISKEQFKKHENYYSEDVYFAHRIASFERMVARLRPYFFDLTRPSTEKHIASCFLITGNRGVYDIELTQDALNTLQKEFANTLLGRYLHTSSFIWMCNGIPLTLPLSLSDIPPGSFICCLPYRGCIQATSNECVSLTLLVAENRKLLVSHRGISISPSSLPSIIDISLGDPLEATFHNSCITTESQGNIKLAWEVLTEKKEPVTDQVPTQIKMVNKLSKSPIGTMILNTESEKEFEAPLISVEPIQWLFEIHFGKHIISRTLEIQPVIGTPDILSLVGWGPHHAQQMKIPSPGEAIILSCGETYEFKWDVHDKSFNTFDIASWKNQGLSVQNITYDPIALGGGNIQIDGMSNMSVAQRGFPIMYAARISAPSGQVKFFPNAFIHRSKRPIGTPLVDAEPLNIGTFSPIVCTIIAGKPKKIVAPEHLPMEEKTYQPFVIRVQLADIGDNVVTQITDIKLQLNGVDLAHTKSKDLDFTFDHDGWYIKEVTFIKAGHYTLSVSQKGRSKRQIQTTIEEYHFPSISIEDATNIAKSIAFKKFGNFIKAGESLDVKCVALSAHLTELHSVHINYRILPADSHDDMEISCNLGEPLTRAGNYTLEAHVDKDYTPSGRDLIKRKSFCVTPLGPSSIELSIPLDARVILNATGGRPWIWKDRLTISLVDCYHNLCSDHNDDKFIHVEIINTGATILSSQPAPIWKKSFPLRNGKIDLPHGLFTSINDLMGQYQFIISYDPPQKESITKIIEFSTAGDAESLSERKRQLLSQMERKQAELISLEQEYLASPFFKQSRTMKEDHRTVLKKLELLEAQQSRKKTVHGTFLTAFEQVRSMRIYANETASFLGPVCNLGYIGGGSNTAVEHALNAELTQWLGHATLSTIITSGNYNHLGKEVHREMHRGAHIKLRGLSDQAPHHIRYLARSHQKLIEFPGIHSPGFLGYAVNLITLDAHQLHLDLRARLWFELLNSTLVFDTQIHLVAYCDSISPRERDKLFAFALDGFQKRGKTLDLYKRSHSNSNNVRFAFASPPFSDQRNMLRNQRDTLASEMNKGKHALNRIDRVSRDLSSILHKIEKLPLPYGQPQQEYVSLLPRDQLSRESDTTPSHNVPSRDPRTTRDPRIASGGDNSNSGDTRNYYAHQGRGTPRTHSSSPRQSYHSKNSSNLFHEAGESRKRSEPPNSNRNRGTAKRGRI